ncbi:hypothetical protein D3C78_589280 [compost metagenome]
MAQVVVPVAQGARVVGAEVLEVQQVHVAVAADGGQHRLDRRQRAAGEDVALDEVDAVARLAVALVADGDGLQQHQPVRLEQLRALAEVLGQVAVADRLDHLDRHQLVELAVELAIVLEQQGDAIFQAHLGDALRGVGVLLARQGGGGHPAAVVAGRVQRHAAPAGADLQQVVGGLEVELLADALQLVELRLLEAVGRIEEHRRRVHHGRVEEGLEQLVAEIVVGGDVLLRAGPRVAIEPVQGAQHRPAQGGQATLQGVEHLEVGDEHADHRGQVRAAPVAVDVGLAGADRTVAGDQAPGGAVVDVDFAMQRGVRIAEAVALVALDQQQAATAQLAELAQHGAAQQAGSQAIGKAGTGGGQARGLHGLAP